MVNKKLTIILPCAGEGSRLGLPYSKEIFAIQPGKSLIDFSLDLFKNCNKNQIEFAITITQKKIDLVTYLSRYAKNYKFSFTYFDEYFRDFPGSVRSAQHLIGQYNLILLPDTKIKADFNIYDVLINSLEKNDCIILYKKSVDAGYMLSKGCIEVNSDFKLISYADKPAGVGKFNGVWCGIGFRKDAFESVIGVVESATFKSNDLLDLFNNSKMKNALCIPVEDFVDLGTWPDINAYKALNDH